MRETGLASNVAFRDGDGRVIDIGNRYGHPGNYDYANVSVWSPQIFERIPSGKKVSFIPVLAEWIGAGGRIGGVVSQEGRWWNLGSRAEYLAVHRTLSEEGWRPDYVQPPAWPIRIAPDAIDRSERASARLFVDRRRLPDRRRRDRRGLDPLARRANCLPLPAESLYRPHPAQRGGRADRRSYLDWPEEE